ncbi:hypothetical protein PMAYCL1PPCAC_08632, partial [Pristionchus mayeri]
CSAAKIAVVSYNLGTSHIMFSGAIADTLVEAGHTVHFFQVQQDNAIRTNGSHKAHRTFFIPSVAHNVWNDMAFRVNPFKPFNVETPSFFLNVTSSFDQSCHDVLASRDMLEVLGRTEHYDIGISEAYGFHGFGILYILGVREYVLSTAIPFQPAFAAMFGIPTPVSYVTNCLDGVGSLEAPNLSYFRRIYNTALHALNYWIYQRFAEKNTKIFRTVYPKMPDLEELVKSAALILVNTPSLLEMPRPTTHKVLHIGGIAEGRERKEPLNTELAHIMSTNRPIVVISFGTLARTVFIEGELLHGFLSAFARFPQFDFVWKFDDAEQHRTIFRNHSNVYTFKWLPQKALLNHPNTKAFITHVGLNSMLEAAQAGVPMVAVPLFTDQQYNTAIARQKGIAVYVDKTELSANTIGEALRRVLLTKKYQANSARIRAQLRAFPRQPKSELVSFINFVAEFGAPRGELHQFEKMLIFLSFNGMFDLPSHSFIFTQSLDIYIPAAIAATLAAVAAAALFVYIYGEEIPFLKVSIEVDPLDGLLDKVQSYIYAEDEDYKPKTD